MPTNEEIMTNNIFKNSKRPFGGFSNNPREDLSPAFNNPRGNLSPAFNNPGQFSNALGYVPETASEGYQDHLANKSVFTTPGSDSYNAQHDNKFQQMADERVSADRYANIRKFRNNIDFEDKEGVKELQGYLGVEQDGMFGPKTERAWRQAVSGMDKADAVASGATPAQAEKEVLRYDWNDAALNDRVRGSKFKLGGKLREAWTNLDENVFKGALPGGYDKDISNMSAEEYYEQQDKPKSSSRLFKGLFGKKASDADVREKY